MSPHTSSLTPKQANEGLENVNTALFPSDTAIRVWGVCVRVRVRACVFYWIIVNKCVFWTILVYLS